MRFNPKPKSRWKWLLVPVAFVVAAGVAGKMLNTSPPTNNAQTSPDAAPDLKTRVYSQSVEQVYAAAQAVVSEQKTWFKAWKTVHKSEVGAGAEHRRVNVEVPVIFFTDDLTINIGAGEGGATVNVESKSRVGEGDFGENRRHVAQFLRALDERLKSS